jgi:hypothetical protein
VADGSVGIFIEVFLVVVLGFPEGLGGHDLGDNGSAEGLSGRQLGDDFFGDDGLSVGMGKDGGAVLCADVRPLSIWSRGVVNLEEILPQLAVGDDAGVEFQMHDLGMIGVAEADAFIGGVVDPAAHKADFGFDDAGDVLEGVFDTPEAAGGESCLFCCLLVGHGNSPYLPAGEAGIPAAQIEISGK